MSEPKKVSLDLRYDVPQDIGFQTDGKTKKRFFESKDIPLILECLSEKMKAMHEPEEDIIFKVFIFGIMPGSLLAIMTYNLSFWDDVESLTYTYPGSMPEVIFSKIRD
ncbi:hypothetical protein DU52_15460 [Methanosarcina mazei]|uniref:SMODS-associated and fused to various effectors domain-containing protein n=1 Tax=Methanosarcina mazei TaxID=2209 RepID=A0A0F8E6E1_METMZ|nr:hypothetical protein [Methanosarcina mazei]KKG35336.1 hypothetical protein DU52_15460 [Methanosarcina mazei]